MAFFQYYRDSSCRWRGYYYVNVPLVKLKALKWTDFINFFGTFLNFSWKTSNIIQDNKSDTADALFYTKVKVC